MNRHGCCSMTCVGLLTNEKRAQGVPSLTTSAFTPMHATAKQQESVIYRNGAFASKRQRSSKCKSYGQWGCECGTWTEWMITGWMCSSMWGKADNLSYSPRVTMTTSQNYFSWWKSSINDIILINRPKCAYLKRYADVNEAETMHLNHQTVPNLQSLSSPLIPIGHIYWLHNIAGYTVGNDKRAT